MKSDIDPVSKDVWHNQDRDQRVPYGSIPLTGDDQVQSDDVTSFEAMMEGAVASISWNGDKPAAKKVAGVAKVTKRASKVVD